METSTARPLPRVARVQGGYYILTGLAPIVAYPLFERVTGPKADDWLVRMVGLLAAAIGAVLLRPLPVAATGIQRQLAITSALSFAAIDVWYALRGRISAVYLLDAVAELALAAAWRAVPTPTVPSVRRAD